jgi:hypothetical protein
MEPLYNILPGDTAQGAELTLVSSDPGIVSPGGMEWLELWLRLQALIE